ncbi:hypothetical protein BCR34DRAFT_566257 [Clohesyomyces aquaticus]|uniref:Uncharacterized protein n=1 Tax=Clohesyomyces aquaticus TaxID=1231657 RepID=A0A1Y1ZKI8_9PLEO|nr:hypothetical protein BCR34DRAFT_566257 [Clohesyomyces aquaticus]
MSQIQILLLSIYSNLFNRGTAAPSFRASAAWRQYGPKHRIFFHAARLSRERLYNMVYHINFLSIRKEALKRIIPSSRLDFRPENLLATSQIAEKLRMPDPIVDFMAVFRTREAMLEPGRGILV